LYIISVVIVLSSTFAISDYAT